MIVLYFPVPDTGFIHPLNIWSYPQTLAVIATLGFFICELMQSRATLPNKKTPAVAWGLVPETGFEPAHPFGRRHLKTVRLPISPFGRDANITGFVFSIENDVRSFN